MKFEALDDLWKRSGKTLFQIPKGTKLWHGGIIGPNYAISGDHLLWTTRLEDQKDWYDGQAREFAKYRGLKPYRLELMVKEVIICADFKSASLIDFTMKYCNCQHETMKKFLKEWVCAKNLGGVVAINGGPDEVVVRNPNLVLQVVEMTPI